MVVVDDQSRISITFVDIQFHFFDQAIPHKNIEPAVLDLMLEGEVPIKLC
jgi:hypothetical protein